MSIKIVGVDVLLEQLEKKLGPERMHLITNEAIKEGAEYIKDELNASIGTSGKYADGYTVEDTSVKMDVVRGKKTTAKIHWNGPHGRYRIIHLNEWGTVKNPSPPRKGAITRAMRTGSEPYREIIKNKVVEGIRK